MLLLIPFLLRLSLFLLYEDDFILIILCLISGKIPDRIIIRVGEKILFCKNTEKPDVVKFYSQRYPDLGTGIGFHSTFIHRKGFFRLNIFAVLQNGKSVILKSQLLYFIPDLLARESKLVKQFTVMNTTTHLSHDEQKIFDKLSGLLFKNKSRN